MCNVYINVLLYVYISVHEFLCMCLMIFSSLINLWYALLASSQPKKKIICFFFQTKTHKSKTSRFCIGNHVFPAVKKCKYFEDNC